MAIKKVLSAVFFLMATFVVSCSDSESKSDPGTKSQGDASKLSSGFANNCASCHGATGGGGSQRSIQGYSGTLSAFTSIVRSGKSGMPATSSSAYSDSELNADYTYLKSL